MAFYDEKGWYKSRTVWTGLVSVIFGILGLFGVLPPALDATAVVDGIMVAVGALTVFFRSTATKEVVLTERK